MSEINAQFRCLTCKTKALEERGSQRKSQQTSGFERKKRLRNRWRSRIVMVQQIDKRNRGNFVVVFLSFCENVYSSISEPNQNGEYEPQSTTQLRRSKFSFFFISPLDVFRGGFTRDSNKIPDESIGLRGFTVPQSWWIVFLDLQAANLVWYG